MRFLIVFLLMLSSCWALQETSPAEITFVGTVVDDEMVTQHLDLAGNSLKPGHYYVVESWDTDYWIHCHSDVADVGDEVVVTLGEPFLQAIGYTRNGHEAVTIYSIKRFKNRSVTK